MTFTIHDLRYPLIAHFTGSGPYHPAVRIGPAGKLYYWPNVTFSSPQDAIDWAVEAIESAYQTFANHVNEWNIFQ